LLSQGSEEGSHVTQGSVAKTPYFLEHSLSGGDNRRDRLFRAWSGLRWHGKNRQCPERILGGS